MFNGPIFIIGLGRSGTKLLRDLLNNHPKISIPEDETGFIPYLLRKYESADISKLVIQRKLYYEIKETSFYIAQEDRGKTMSYEKFLDLANQSASLAHLIEWVLRYYSPKGLQTMPLIWGDKTPRYMDYVQLLNKFFPNSRFIHIYRDVRDYALSYKKTWGKSIHLSAYRWQNKILDFETNKNIDFKEVKYEDLIKNSDKVLKELCEYLEIEYFDGMKILKTSSEKFGDAKNRTEIMSDNLNKYKRELKKQQIKEIEELAYDALLLKNYTPYFATKEKGINQYKLNILKIQDFVNYASHILLKERGIRRGVIYLLYSLKNKVK